MAGLPGEIEIAIYRIVQEALTNIAKYARAESISILVETRASEIVVVIEDDGIGFDVINSSSAKQLGLVGMRERAELLGGKLKIESQPGEGTTIFVRIPVKMSEIVA